MAHQKHRALVVLQQVFQQLQGVDVQVVGRLVQHQYIGRTGEQARQQQAVAFATGEGAHRRVGTRWREQEIAEVTFDVLALAADLYPFAARADEILQAGVQIKRVAHLVEIGHLDLRALSDLAAVGLQFAQDQLEQRGLARAVRADQAHLVATQDGAAELANNGPGVGAFAKGFADIGQLGHDLSGGRARGQVELDTAERVAPGLTRAAQRFKAHDAALAAGAARFHALANPDLFLREQLVGLGGDHRFLRHLLFFLKHKLREVAGVGAQYAPVQLDDPGGNPVEKGAVMGDGDDAALETHQQVFEPFDRIHVEVVGRLVQQQHLGPADQRLSQGYPLACAAREGADHGLAVQVQAVQGFLDPLLPVPAVLRFDRILQRVQVAFT